MAEVERTNVSEDRNDIQYQSNKETQEAEQFKNSLDNAQNTPEETQSTNTDTTQEATDPDADTTEQSQQSETTTGQGEENPLDISPEYTAPLTDYNTVTPEDTSPETVSEMFDPSVYGTKANETKLDTYLPDILNAKDPTKALKAADLSKSQEKELIEFAKSLGYEGITRVYENGQGENRQERTTYNEKAALNFLVDQYQQNQQLDNVANLPSGYDILQNAREVNYVAKKDDEGRVTSSRPEPSLEGREKFDESSFGKRVNEFVPDLLAGNTELPTDKQALEDLVEFAEQAGYSNMPEGRKPDRKDDSLGYREYRRAVQKAKDMPLEQKAQEALDYLKEGRYLQNSLVAGSNGPDGKTRLIFSDSFVDTSVQFGINEGVITQDIAADAALTSNMLLSTGESLEADADPVQLNPQNFGIALAQRFDAEGLENNEVIAAYNYVQGGKTLGEQRERLAKTILAFQTDDKAGTAAMTKTDWMQAFNEAGPEILEIMEYRNRYENPFSSKNDKIFDVIGVPGYHKLKLSKKRKAHLVNGYDGQVQQMQMEKKQSGFAKYARPIMDAAMGVVAFVPGGQAVAAGYFAVRAAEDASKGNYVGAAMNAFGAFGAYGNIATLNAAGKVTATQGTLAASRISGNLARAGQGALGAYMGVKNDDLLAGVSGGLNGLSGVSGLAGANNLATFTQNASYLTGAADAIQDKNIAGALHYGANLFGNITDANNQGFADTTSFLLRNSGRVAGVVEGIEEDDIAGAISSGAQFVAGTSQKFLGEDNQSFGIDDIANYVSNGANLFSGIKHQNSGRIEKGLSGFAQDPLINSKLPNAFASDQISKPVNLVERTTTPEGLEIFKDDQGNEYQFIDNNGTRELRPLAEQNNIQLGQKNTQVDNKMHRRTTEHVTQDDKPKIFSESKMYSVSEMNLKTETDSDTGEEYQVVHTPDGETHIVENPQLDNGDNATGDNKQDSSEQEFVAGGALDISFADIEAAQDPLQQTPHELQFFDEDYAKQVLQQMDRLDQEIWQVQDKLEELHSGQYQVNAYRQKQTELQLQGIELESDVNRFTPRPVFRPGLELTIKQELDEIDAQLEELNQPSFSNLGGLATPFSAEYQSLSAQREALQEQYDFQLRNTVLNPIELESQIASLEEQMDPKNRISAVEYSRLKEQKAELEELYKLNTSLPDPLDQAYNMGKGLEAAQQLEETKIELDALNKDFSNYISGQALNLETEEITATKERLEKLTQIRYETGKVYEKQVRPLIYNLTQKLDALQADIEKLTPEADFYDLVEDLENYSGAERPYEAILPSNHIEDNLSPEEQAELADKRSQYNEIYERYGVLRRSPVGGAKFQSDRQWHIGDYITIHQGYKEDQLLEQSGQGLYAIEFHPEFLGINGRMFVGLFKRGIKSTGDIVSAAAPEDGRKADNPYALRPQFKLGEIGITLEQDHNSYAGMRGALGAFIFELDGQSLKKDPAAPLSDQTIPRRGGNRVFDAFNPFTINAYNTKFTPLPDAGINQHVYALLNPLKLKKGDDGKKPIDNTPFHARFVYPDLIDDKGQTFLNEDGPGLMDDGIGIEVGKPPHASLGYQLRWKGDEIEGETIQEYLHDSIDKPAHLIEEVSQALKEYLGIAEPLGPVQIPGEGYQTGGAINNDNNLNFDFDLGDKPSNNQ